MNDITDRILKLSAEYKIPATTLMITYFEKLSQYENRAVYQLQQQGKRINYMNPDETLPNHTVDVMERYLEIHKSKDL